jgi:hypothetical protein
MKFKLKYKEEFLKLCELHKLINEIKKTNKKVKLSMVGDWVKEKEKK